MLEAIVDYADEGYAAYLGWIQVIRYAVPGDVEVGMVDTPPQMADAGIPWASWGGRPALSDAPSTDELEFRFRARTFLAFSPDPVMMSVVEPLCGFSWGYDVHEGTPADERARGTALRMLIADASDGRMLGAIALQRLDWDDGSGELGYRVTASARGRGVAGRAVGLMTVFSELRLGRVDAIPDLDNDVSRRLLERCGFELAGELRNRRPPAALYSAHARPTLP